MPDKKSLVTREVVVLLDDWMFDYIDDHELKFSKLIQDAVCAHRDEMNSYYGNGEQSGLRGAIDRLDMAVESRLKIIEEKLQIRTYR